MKLASSPPPLAEQRLCWRDLLPGLCLGLLLIGGLGVATMWPVDPVNLAVLFNPSLSRDDIIARVAASGGIVERSGGWPNLVVVRLAAGTVAGLYAHGAWLVMNPLVNGGCSHTTPLPTFIKSRAGAPT